MAGLAAHSTTELLAQPVIAHRGHVNHAAHLEQPGTRADANPLDQ